MKYENYGLPGGKTLSAVTFEDIRWQYGVFRCNSTGAGRDKNILPGEPSKPNWVRLKNVTGAGWWRLSSSGKMRSRC